MWKETAKSVSCALTFDFRFECVVENDCQSNPIQHSESASSRAGSASFLPNRSASHLERRVCSHQRLRNASRPGPHELVRLLSSPRFVLFPRDIYTSSLLVLGFCFIVRSLLCVNACSAFAYHMMLLLFLSFLFAFFFS